MSLLLDITDHKIEKIAEQIYKLQFAREARLDDEYDDYRKTKMFRDIKYNLKTLEVAVRYDAEEIFKDYADWLIRLLYSRMKDISAPRVREQLINHYQIIGEVIKEEFAQDYYQKAEVHLNNAIKVTEEAELDKKTSQEITPDNLNESELKRLQFKYLNSLLLTDRDEAQMTVEEALAKDISVEMIYKNIFQESMIRVGELWNSNQITVDEEHYITGITQNVMMQLWPQIMDTEKNDLSLVACTIGNELHEMGVRMLCDMMENKGWKTIYLGAAIPVSNILTALKKHQPDLVVLSVTMPFHLEQCEEAVRKIKASEEFNDIKIAVGGRAFSLATHLPGNWEADVTARDADELAEWAKENI
ncbi:MAG: cobalamin B12-binding domain-containing protein [Bacillota bacterium]